MPDEVSDYTRGWMEADYAIKHKLSGSHDYSSGNTDWDNGWNKRMDYERQQEKS